LVSSSGRSHTHEVQYVLKQKSEVKERFIPFLKELQHTYGVWVEHIRCDNAGENRALEDACIENDLGIIFEYTAPGTPQQNGVVERAFATMLGKTRAIMNGAGFDEKKHHLFWTEAANTVTHLENITTRKGTTRTPHYLFYGSDAPYAKHLQVFGKLGIVKVLQLTNKLSDKGMKAIFVGYADKHAGNVYRFINPSTNRIILSRDMKWLERKYGDEKNVKPSFISNVYHDIKGYEEIDDDGTTTADSDKETNTNNLDTDEEVEIIMPSTTTAIGPPIESRRELQRELRGIDIGQELMPGRTRQQTRDAIQLLEENFDNFYRDCALMSAVTNTGQNNKPRNFQEAWYHQNPEKRQNWRVAIRKEFKDMIR